MENTIQFIEVVKRHEAIYDTMHKDYKNMERKANAWMEVAQEMGLTVEACKRKWKNLRDSYTKYLRSFRTGTKTSRKYQYWAHAMHMEFLRPFQGPGRSQGMKMEDPYDKFEHMEFLRPFQNAGRFKMEDSYDDGYKYKQECDFGFEVLEKFSPDEDVDILDTTTEHQKLDTPPLLLNNAAKNKSMLRFKDLDSTSMFFLSLAKSVRTMPKKYQASIKMQCMKIVNDAEIQIENVAEIHSNILGSNGALSPNDNDANSPAEGSKILEANELESAIEAQEIKKQDQNKPQQEENGKEGDNSEHFLYVMSPSKVEAMIDISSDEEN